MKKNYLLATALAIMTMASCSDDNYVGDQEALQGAGEGAISFDLNTAAVTRATGGDAATALGDYFLIYGEKKESSKAIYSDGNLVFPNYTVKYVANTANTTTSNSKNWEYVNITPLSTTNVKIEAGANDVDAPSEQTIKYWDYSAPTYTFTAVSAKSSDITDGKVIVQKNAEGTSTVYDKGYTITLKTGADATKLFFADRNVVTKSTNTDRNTAGYGGYVQMNFRNLLSQIRVGMYETILGYQVDVVKFYYDDSADPAISSMATSDATNNFYANLVHQKATGFTSDITLTVTYKDNTSSAENQPTVAVSGGNATNYLTLGTNIANPADTYLGEDANHVIFDQSTANTYTTVFPQESNTHDLKLKVDYTLYNSITKETIDVTGATAVVPAEYLQWKANYKYTYIFKISDNTDGHAGTASDPAGLYPITLDAVTVDASDGSELQYITTVTEPSITTYANASNVVADNEYKSGSNIYVVVNDGVALTVDTNAKLYTAEVEDGAAQGITEETVKNAIAVNSDGYDFGTVLAAETNLNGYYTYNSGTNSYVACAADGEADGSTKYYKPVTASVKDANGKKLVVKAAAGLTATTSIPAADTPDGIAITVNGAKFTPAAAGYYVFEYIDTTPDPDKKYYKVIKVVAGS